MFPVSEAYKAAIAAPQRVTRVAGSITRADDSKIAISDADIVMGSLYLSSQCVSADDIDVGSVYASELGFALKTNLENPYSLEGARVTLQFGVEVAGGTVEWVPLGYFYADTPTRQAGKVALKCYDGMLLFDKPIGTMPAADTPYFLLLAACNAANVTLAPLQADIEALPNGTLTLTPPAADSAIKTWRDLLMWVCQALGGWATLTRHGQLDVRGYTPAAQRSIQPDIRMRTTAADTQVNITQVTMKLGEADYSQGDGGMTLALESNPLFAALEPAQADAALAALLARLKTIQYVPATVEFNGDPALDPGDLVALPATAAGNLVVPIMKSTWRYRGRHDIAAVGKSGRLRAEYSQANKALSSVSAAAAAAAQLARTANQSAQLLNDTLGGHVLIRQGEESNEILIMDSADPHAATKIWRWNLNGLGYSADGKDINDSNKQYDLAITMDGEINAKFVKSGIIDAGVVFAGKLSATSGSFANLFAGKLDAAGNPVGAHMKLGIDTFGDPYIDIYNDAGARQRSIRKDGDVYGSNAKQQVYPIGTRIGIGTFVGPSIT